MKLQNLTILFILLIIPIALVMGLYIRGQAQTLTLQTKYDKALSSSTYDAVSAYRINTESNELVDNPDSIREDIEAATSTFMMSMASNLNVAKDDVIAYVPAMLYTLYDGYYIYSAVKDDTGNIEYTLKPYIYYSEKIQDEEENVNVVINYTLDNWIAIYGQIGDKYIAKSGYLIDRSKYDKIGKTYKINDKEYPIAEEELKENILIRVPYQDTVTDPDTGSITNAQKYDYIVKELKYRFIDQKKVYYLNEEINDKDGNTVFSQGWYTYSSTRGELIESSYTGDGATAGYVKDDSAIKYYEEAWNFTDYLLNDCGIASIDSLSFLRIGADNDPEDRNSEFSQHKREIIRQSIETNLKNAIDTFSSMSQALGSTYNYKMPIMLEEDWEKIYTEVSMTTFFQGLPIGFKTYNNYSIISVTGNNQFVNPELLYFIGNDGEYHKITCGNLTTTTGYRSIAFEQYKVQITKTNAIGEEDISDTVATYNYYYKHSETGDYDCIVQDKTESGVYKNGYFSDKLINPEEVREENNAKAYFTTLARERYNQYKATGYLNQEFEIEAEEPVPVAGDNDFTYKIILYTDKPSRYTVTENGTDIIKDKRVDNNIELKSGTIKTTSFDEGDSTKTISFNTTIEQTYQETDGYYKITDPINVNIQFDVRINAEGKVISENYTTKDIDTLTDKYGNTVATITPDDISDSQNVNIFINIKNVPKTYVESGNMELVVKLNAFNKVEIEPNLSGIQGEISLLYFIRNENNVETLDIIKFGENETYKGGYGYYNNTDTNKQKAIGKSENNTWWYKEEWQLLVLDYNGDPITVSTPGASGFTGQSNYLLGKTSWYKIDNAGGIQALAIATNDANSAITKRNSKTSCVVPKINENISYEDADDRRIFKLTNNAENVGTIQPIANFEGEFYGNGNTISGVTIGKKSTKDNSNGIGLFASNNGIIQNLVVNNITVSYTNPNEYSNYSGGVIGLNESGGTAQNITVQNSSITGNTYVGGVIGGNEANIISNLKVIDTNITAKGDDYSDGNSVSGAIPFYDTVNNKKITHIICIGGIVGASEGDIKNVNIEGGNVKLDTGEKEYLINSKNEETDYNWSDGISYANYIGNYVGGIVGYTSGSINTQNPEEENTVETSIAASMKVSIGIGNFNSSASITYQEIYYGHKVFVGGIAGGSMAKSTQNTINNTTVYNTTIDATKVEVKAIDSNKTLMNIVDVINETNVGGALGSVEKDVSLDNVEISGSTINGKSNVGGIAGSNFTGLTSINTQVNSSTISGERNLGGIVGYNAGKVMGFTNSSTITSGKNIGGIVGYNENGEIYDCRNNGRISTNNLTCNATDTDAGEDNLISENSGIGGICGFNNKGTIRVCSNSGYIKGNFNLGGIVGINYEGTVKECSNKGDLETTEMNRVGGIIGVMSKGTIMYCYNTGNIKGMIYTISNRPYKDPTGGIVGIIYRTGNQIKYCYSTGKITGEGLVVFRYYMGGIVGYSVASDGNIVLQPKKFYENYYLSGTVNEGNGGWNAGDKNDCNGKSREELMAILLLWMRDNSLKNDSQGNMFIEGYGYEGYGALWFEEGSETPYTSNVTIYHDEEEPDEEDRITYTGKFEEGYYEITLVAGGGGGYNGGAADRRGGGSGSAYKGTIYLKTGNYQWEVGGYRKIKK